MKDKMMVKINDIEGQIERKKEYVGFLINSIADRAESAKACLDNGEINWTYNYSRTIRDLAEEVEEEKVKIRELRDQISLIKDLMKEGV